MVPALATPRVRRRWRSLPLVLVFGALLAAGCRSREPELPSFLLFTIDTLRADHLPVYGYFRDTAPELTRFAGEAMVFERCLAPMAVTLPSHVSLLTATEPPEHGVLANVRHGGQPFKLHSGLEPFTAFAQRLGYRTAAFVSATPLKRGTGIEIGFETFGQPARHERRAESTVAEALTWLDTLAGAGEEPTGEPFFLWVHVFDPHAPYAAPEEFQGRFAADAELAAYMTERAIPAQWPGGRRDEPADTAEHLDRYDEEILYVDGQFARLRQRLEELDLWSSLVVIVAGDHGEGLGQHGETGHGNVYWEQLHTPLVVRVPGGEPARVDAPLTLTDTMPTVLARIDSEPWAAFLEQATGVDALAPGAERRGILSWRTGRQRRNLGGPGWALTAGGLRFVRQPEEVDLLFDLETDPYELVDLAAARPEVASRYRAELERRLAELEGRGPGDAETEGLEEFDPQRLEELRALGYVD